MIVFEKFEKFEKNLHHSRVAHKDKKYTFIQNWSMNKSWSVVIQIAL